MAVRSIPVIDLFSGPGGLSEGFSRFGEQDWNQVLSPPTDPSGNVTKRLSRCRFQINLSVEKDPFAHETLQLRAFFRAFGRSPPAAYYDHIRGNLSRADLFALFPTQKAHAQREAILAELGTCDERDIDTRIYGALGSNRTWVLIGGPPCQAYSIAGRSRRRGMAEYSAAEDNRHFLYKEYLRIVAKHEPPVFVMENVKGMLSSRVDGEQIVERILGDLREPGRASRTRDKGRLRYKLFALCPSKSGALWEVNEPRDYVLCMERFGIPQARHRVIILGVREDGPVVVPRHLVERKPVSVRDVIRGLPSLRSGLSREDDTPDAWLQAVQSADMESWFRKDNTDNARKLRRLVRHIISSKSRHPVRRGGLFVPCEPRVSYAPAWYLDPRLNGVCNHETRSHIVPDLHRYLFAACYGEVHGASPRLGDFPSALMPDHRNAALAVREGGNFNDRFRVQLSRKPATTVTSHISKDGHYYIHYDPLQCRALTVREAARIQTFPDNYFFCGNRTQQYHQVGNAVPPLLAVQIAGVVADVLDHSLIGQ